MCWRKRPWQLTSTLAVAVGLLAASATPTLAATGTPAPATGSAGSGHTAGVPLQSVPPAPTLPTRPLPVTGGAPAPAPAGVSAAALPVGASIDLKVLVVYNTTGAEVELPAVTKTLDYLGTPYTVYNAAATPGGLTADKLATGSHALYSGVILTDSSLGVTGGALSATELTTLTSYEGTFGIRQVTWYTFPNTYYGFTGTPTSTTAATPASYTTAGATVFSYVNATNPLTISNATTYLAPAATDPNNSVLLTSGANALALVHTYPAEGNRMNLALTFDSNEFLTHNLVLGYGLVNWVNGGLYLGERHSYLEPQPDDILLASGDNTWPVTTACGTPVDSTPTTFRMTGTDLRKAVDWQKTVQANPVSAQVALEWPFNGDGATTPPPDTLTPAVKTLQGNFKWISHTFDHENLDAITYAAAVSELTQNNTAAATLGLTTFNTSRLITPDVSGLDNPLFLQAALDNGVRFLVSDTSIKGPATATTKRSGDNPSPNAGRTNPSQPAILEVPRHPTNLYFNVTTPAEWLAEDHCLYPLNANGHVADYPALLDRESEVLLGYLLRGDMDPLMFHQPNLKAYDGVHSLLSDLLDATLAKYNRSETLPILSPTLDQVGAKMAARMSNNSAGVTASIVPNQSITLTATQNTTVPVSGLTPITPTPSVTTETYGGQPISYVTLQAGVPITIRNVADPIDTKRAEPAMAFLGADVGDRQYYPGGGISQQYQNGAIDYAPATGAHEVHGLIAAHYAELGGPTGLLGFPLTDETATPDGTGRYNHFTGGSIYWTPATGAHEVHGAIREQWAAMGWELGVAGYPLTDETATPDGTGRFNHFTGGSIYWTPATGAHEVHGAIREQCAAMGWERSVAGYPTTDETDIPGVPGGRMNAFSATNLVIYWSASTGAHETYGSIRQYY